MWGSEVDSLNPKREMDGAADEVELLYVVGWVQGQRLKRAQ